jgi:hypothetical protein
MAGARAEPDREAVLERPVALPGAVRDPGVARHRRALQADLHRGGLGADPPVPHHGGVHGDFWPAGQVAHRGGCALSGARVCRDAALAVLQHRTEQLLRQSDQQCQPAHQGVLPTADRAGISGDHQLCGLPDLVCNPGRADAVVSVVAHLATAHVASVGGGGLCGQHGGRPLAGQPERSIPRFSLCGAFSGPVWPLREPGGVLQRDCASQVATALRTQPNGGSDRGLPLGDHRPGLGDQPGRLLAVDDDRGAAAGHGRPPVQADGEALCGCDLSGRDRSHVSPDYVICS